MIRNSYPSLFPKTATSSTLEDKVRLVKIKGMTAIHAGNTAKDTGGCISVGPVKQKNFIGTSKLDVRR